MRVRLSDLAAEAGVSEATVSRVLNGRPGVAPATRAAVLAALDVLGYERPSALRVRSAGLVGLVVPELGNPIFPAFAQVVSGLLTQYGYTAVLCTTAPGGMTEQDYLEMLLERGVSGFIFVSGQHSDTEADHSHYVSLVDRRLPLVLVNGFSPRVDAAFISTDDAAAAQMSVSHLVSLGHSRIGLAVGPQRYVPVIRKRAAFLAAVADLLGEDAVDESLIAHTIFSVEGGQAAAARLLERGATALVCGSDLMALGAVRAARSQGLRVPEDVSIVGYDDSGLMAFTDPPLTTVRQSVTAMATAVVQTLLDEIGGAPTPRVEYLFRPELVVRGSTAAGPSGRARRRTSGRPARVPRQPALIR